MIFGEFVRVPGVRRYGIDLLKYSREEAFSALFPADRKGQWHSDQTALVQHTRFNTYESHVDTGPLHCPVTQLTLTAWSRLDNRDDLIGQLYLPTGELTITDNQLILASYQRWGEDCVNHLLGDFVFAVWDAKRQTLFCARDHMGCKPLYYYLDDTRCIFASTLKVFRDLPGFSLTTTQRWIAEYLLGLSMSFDATPYRGILKLPPGHCLSINSKYQALRAYFQLGFGESLRLDSSQDYVETYREALSNAVKRRVSSNYALGSELSGGLDSSAITAFAARLIPTPEAHLHAFALTLCEQEPEYIHAVKNHCGLKHLHVLDHVGLPGDQEIDLLKKSVDLLGYPEEHSMGSSHEGFYQLASNAQIRTLLSGFGGDEFVTHQSHAALYEWQYQRQWRYLYQNLPGTALLRLLRLIKQLYWPRRSIHELLTKEVQKQWTIQPLNPELSERYQLYQKLIKPLPQPCHFSSLNDYILKTQWAPYLPTRLETCTLIAAGHGVEYRWPLLDVELVQCFLSMPTSQKYERGISRAIHRRAIEPYLPAKVVWKPTKFMGNPTFKYSAASLKHYWDEMSLHPELYAMISRGQWQTLLQEFTEPGIDYQTLLLRYHLVTRMVRLNYWLSDASGSKIAVLPGT